MLTVYTYKSCDSCRRAVKWLGARAIPFVEKSIRETPPGPSELRAMLAYLGGQRRALCNTSGKDYREQNFGALAESLNEAEFLARLSANGNLIKRPFLLPAAHADTAALAVGLVGFSEKVWNDALGPALG